MDVSQIWGREAENRDPDGSERRPEDNAARTQDQYTNSYKQRDQHKYA
jgi:hypothetical protein